MLECVMRRCGDIVFVSDSLHDTRSGPGAALLRPAATTTALQCGRCASRCVAAVRRAHVSGTLARWQPCWPLAKHGHDLQHLLAAPASAPRPQSARMGACSRVLPQLSYNPRPGPNQAQGTPFAITLSSPALEHERAQPGAWGRARSGHNSAHAVRDVKIVRGSHEKASGGHPRESPGRLCGCARGCSLAARACAQRPTPLAPPSEKGWAAALGCAA